jgi:malate synthase
MTDRIEKFGLQVARPLHDMIELEALPAAGVAPDAFWRGLADLVHELGPRNRVLLARRDELQAQIDEWHRARRGQPHDAAAYRHFLEQIGYLVPEGPDFAVDTANVDPEIAAMPGPQLVVPVMNARYALNAANARWGSLYDALYGTDAMGDLPPAGPYSEERGARVIAWARRFLDTVAPLAGAAHAEVTGYRVEDDQLVAETPVGAISLVEPQVFAG